MEEIIVNNQKELDQIDINFNGIIKIFGINIRIKLKYKYSVVALGNSSVEAWENSSVVALENSSVVARGNSSVEAWENSSVVALENSSVVARENSSVKARGNSSVMAQENSSVEAWENSSVEAWGNSSVEAWGNSSVVALENSSVEARGNSSVEALENSSVVALGNSSVEAWGNSSVEAWGNSSVVAWENVCVRISSTIRSLSLFGFSVLFKPFDLKFKFTKEKTCVVQEIKPQKYLDREGVNVIKGYVILYKKVSRDFKTQENTHNETLWNIGASLSHPSWDPSNKECGPGKYHACSRPYFCDEFRNGKGDQYIAIKIQTDDLYEWDKPEYPHKIAFRKGKVLFKVDRFGKKIAD